MITLAIDYYKDSKVVRETLIPEYLMILIYLPVKIL